MVHRRRRFTRDDRSATQHYQDATRAPKVARRFEGWVADWCYICRAFSFHQLLRYERCGVVGLAVGGTPFLSETVCYECGCTLSAEPGIYGEAQPEAGSSFRDLAAKTHPELIGQSTERVELEGRVKAGRISEEERGKLLREVIGVVNDAGHHEQLLARLTPRGDTTLTVVRFGILTLLAWTAAFLVRPLALYLLILGFLVFFAGIGRYLYRRATHMKRYYRNELQPLLELALAPLRPSKTEVMDAFGSQKRFKWAEVVDLPYLCENVAAKRE